MLAPSASTDGCSVAHKNQNMFILKWLETVEAEVGIEPTHKAFAEPCLTTWLLRRPRAGARIGERDLRASVTLVGLTAPVNPTTNASDPAESARSALRGRVFPAV